MIAMYEWAPGTDNSALRLVFSWIDKRDCAHMLVSFRNNHINIKQVHRVAKMDDWSGSAMEGSRNSDVTR